MKKKIRYFIPAILCMIVIFIFSSQSGAESNKNNLFLITFFQRIGIDITTSLGNDIANFIVRKAAHVTEYLILFLLIYFGLYKNRIRLNIFKAAAYTILYAATDEIHQIFVPERAGMVRDVLIDSIGVVIGALIVLVINKLKHGNDDPIEYVRFEIKGKNYD